MSDRISSFMDLRVYQAACELDYAIFVESKHFPKEEMYSLTDQLRRSSRSIGANSSEAWAKRRYPAHFLSKLTDADGELQETAHWLETAKACEYLSDAEYSALVAQLTDTGRKLGSMIQKHESFCHE